MWNLILNLFNKVFSKCRKGTILEDSLEISMPKNNIDPSQLLHDLESDSKFMAELANDGFVRKEVLQEQDIIAQQAIKAAKLFYAKTPKEAAEMTAGRELAPDEWEQIRSTWERNWF
ncbi:MAG TPA: hypothetical protein DCY07_01200 [Rhodospirillaceae bacterium]|nr:hypothetical protein [Rhodospirillaceae bacterium]